MAQRELLNPSRTVVDLNGNWERHIHGKLVDVISVPSSLRPSGHYRLQRSFLLPRLLHGARAILHLDAVTYYGRVVVNGHELGTTIPYVPHEFEFTALAIEGRNAVAVEIADCPFAGEGAGKDETAFGATGGWESYGGIIRNVYVEVRPAAFIENVAFGYQLSGDYDSVSCSARVFVAAAETQSGECQLALCWGKSEVALARKNMQIVAGTSEAELRFELKAPVLWSPEGPNLYQLRALLKTDSTEDQWACRTGFREFRTRGRDFLLNGKRLVLNGVCRHDMWKEQGFTLSPGQQEQDMRMIKSLGANFVRLVHYPHDRRIVELADQLGLLVSEEPGFWNVDFETTAKSEIQLAYRILERTIRRDWNSPAVIMWLLGNECAFPVSYLQQAKAICNTLDPIHRLVSVAHNNGELPAAKTVFDQAGLDFYDWHAYEYSGDKFARLPESFGPGKPLTLSEWGWEDAGHGAIFYERNFDALLDAVEAGKIAGHAFWSWNDVARFTRVDWPTHNGILLSGAVSEAREIREPVYSKLAALFAERREGGSSSGQDRPTVLPLKWMPFSKDSLFHSADLQALVDSANGRQSWAAIESSLATFWAASAADDQGKRTASQFSFWRGSEVNILGVCFRSPVVNDRVRPVALTAEVSELTIPINQVCAKIHVLGQVSFPLGYPLTGRQGEIVAVYTLEYASGKTQVLPVRNGIEVAQSNRIHRATRIDPIATAAQPALEYLKDIAREQYQVLLWSIRTEPERLVNLRCKLNRHQPALAIFAITSESRS